MNRQKEWRIVSTTPCARCSAKLGEYCTSGRGGDMHAVRLMQYEREHPLGGARQGAGRPATGPSPEALVQLVGPRVSAQVKKRFLALCKRRRESPSQLLRAMVEQAVADPSALPPRDA